METVITSANNPVIKQLRKLMASSKARRETNTYVAEGIHLASSYLSAGGVPLRYVYAQSAPQHQEVAKLLEELIATPAQGTVVADSLFESLANVHASVGILIVFSPQAPTQSDLLPLRRNTIILEDIQDPGNIGTILRTVAAVGVRDVALTPGCSSPWSPKALRAGMGAQFGLRIYEDIDSVVLATAAAIPVLATTLAQDSKSLYDVDLRQPVAWVFGNEGQGVSKTLTNLASTRVSIPQIEGSTIESLNVATAVAVCLYEQYRQRLAA